MKESPPVRRSPGEPQRPEQHPRHAGDSPHIRAGFPQRPSSSSTKDNPFLDQPNSRRTATAMRSSAASSKARTWSTRSACAPARRACTATPAEPVLIKESLPGEMNTMASPQVRLGRPTSAPSHRARRRACSAVDRELPELRAQRSLRRHRLPPRHQGLHGPGRRHGAGPEAEAHEGEIKNEANNGLKNGKYTLAMARTNAPHSATRSSSSTPPTTISELPFGIGPGLGLRRSAAWSTAPRSSTRSEKVRTGSRGFHDDVPVEDVVITRAVIVE